MRHLRTTPPTKKMTKKTHLLEMQAILGMEGIVLDDKTLSKMYDAFVDAIGAALTDGLSVTVMGLGRFETRYRRPKTFTPPNLGYSISLDDRYVPFFVPNRKLKSRVWERPYVKPSPPPKNRARLNYEKHLAEQRRRNGAVDDDGYYDDY